MDVFEYFEEELYKIINTLIEENVISVDALESNITVEPPRNYKHGDITSNVAMTLARFSNMKPAELANLIALEMKKVPEVVRADVAGPGFLNFTLKRSFWCEKVQEILLLDFHLELLEYYCRCLDKPTLQDHQM